MSNRPKNPDLESLVSVVIPYYEHQDFVQQCINSVVAQSYENLELVVIDDCSTDSSGKFVKQMCQKMEIQARFSGRIYFESLPKNLGAHQAINYGISKTKGKFISILNSDDMYHTNRIQLMLDAIQNRNTDFIFSKVNYIDDRDRDITKSSPLAVNLSQLQQKIKNFPTVGFSLLDTNVAISTGNFLFTKALYYEIGGFKNYRYCHDWDFILRATLKTEPYFLEECLYYYRLHNTNSFHTLQQEALTESPAILQHYFNQVRCQPPHNSVAPCSFNWPDYFELFLDLKGYKNWYDSATTLL
jgi:glycosyltransferase involved in cell wall biosynthesis